jgi:outer membrane protein assembly factor BamB
MRIRGRLKGVLVAALGAGRGCTDRSGRFGRVGVGRRTRVFALVAVLAVTLGACDWAQFRFGAEHSGYNPGETTISAANVGQLTQKWTFTSGGPIASSPAVVAGVVYFGSEDDKVYALNATTGALVWSVPTGGAVLQSPAVVNGVVYVGSADHRLYALDAGTGALRWSVMVDANFATFDSTHPSGNVNAGTLGSSPSVAGGTVYVVSSGVPGGPVYEPYFLYAYDAASGAVRWQTRMNTGVCLSNYEICPWAAPTVANGMVYVNNWSTGQAQSFNATTGAIVWRVFFTQTAYPPPAAQVGVTSPTVVNGRVYAAVCCATVLYPYTNVYALDAATGSTVWLGDPDGSILSSAAVADRIYAPGYVAVTAVDPATGALVWSTGNNAHFFLSSPAVANGVVFASSLSALYAFDANTGTQLWSGADGGGVSSPAIANGMVYVGNDYSSGVLTAYGL